MAVLRWHVGYVTVFRGLLDGGFATGCRLIT